MRGLGKKAISSVIAVVLIILITVAAVAIIWLAVLPLVRNSISLSCTDVDLSIGNDGYTCYSQNSNIVPIQVKKGQNNVNIIGVKLLLSSGGNDYAYYANYNFQPNSEKTFYLNSSGIPNVDKIGLVAYYSQGNSVKECSATYIQPAKTCIDGFTLPDQVILLNQTNGTTLGGGSGSGGSANPGCNVDNTLVTGNVSIICNSSFYKDNCGGTHQGLKLPNCTCANNLLQGQSCTDNVCSTTCYGSAVCAPNCACSSLTLVGQNCSDGCGGSCAGTKASQDGSANYPFIITNCTDLENKLWGNLNSYFVLGNNIDCSNTTSWNNGAGFNPVGAPFTGNLDGKGFSVSNLYINRPSSSSSSPVGLFGSISNFGKAIRNLSIVNANVTSGSYSGILAGIINNATIISVSVSGTIVSNSQYIGGFVGQASYSTVLNSSSSGNFNTTYGNYGSAYIGGFIGSLINNVTIDSCFSNSILGITNYEYDVGGFIGGDSQLNPSNNIISNSYSSGKITGAGAGYSNNGGFMGEEYYDTITNSYTSIVSSPRCFCGSFTGTAASNSFYDTVCTNTNSGGAGLSTAQLQSGSGSSNPNLPGWSSFVWNFPGGQYPRLRWQG